jgi:hypothetical protein
MALPPRHLCLHRRPHDLEDLVLSYALHNPREEECLEYGAEEWSQPCASASEEDGDGDE